MSRPMTVLIIKPGQRPKPQEIDGSLESMQSIVGGELQAIYPTEDVALVFNKDAFVQNFPQNRGVSDADGKFLDIIHGTFFLCGAPEDSNYFKSLTEDQMQQYAETFASPEAFLNLGGRTIILPCSEQYWEKNDTY